MCISSQRAACPVSVLFYSVNIPRTLVTRQHGGYQGDLCTMQKGKQTCPRGLLYSWVSHPGRDARYHAGSSSWWCWYVCSTMALRARSDRLLPQMLSSLVFPSQTLSQTDRRYRNQTLWPSRTASLCLPPSNSYETPERGASKSLCCSWAISTPSYDMVKIAC